MVRGLIFSILSACCFGMLPILGKLGYGQGMQAVEMLQYRFVLGASLLFLWFGLTNRKVLRIRPRALAMAALLGLCIYPVQSTCFLRALKYIPASTTSLVFYFYPVTVTLLSALVFRQRIGRTVAFSLLLVMAGCALVFFDAFRQDVDLTGVAYASGAMMVFSIYLLITQVALKFERPLTVSLYVLLFAALSFAFLGGVPDLSRLTMARGAIALGFALVPTVLAVTMLYQAIKAVGSSYVSIFSTLEPVATVTAAVLVLDESLALWQVAGALCIIVGIVLPNLGLLRRLRPISD